MSTPGTRRLAKELEEVSEEGISVEAKESNLFIWEGMLLGPGETSYEGGLFKFVMEFPSGPDGYPFKPPTFHFTTSIYHPNVSDKGLMCIPRIESGSWSATTTPLMILQDVISLLSEPDTDKSTNVEAGQLYVSNKAEFIKKAMEHTKKHAG